MAFAARKVQVLCECPACRITDMDVWQYERPTKHWGEVRCARCGWVVHKISFPEREKGSMRIRKDGAVVEEGSAEGQG